MDKDPSCVSANAVMENQAGGVSKSKHRPIVRIGIFLISHSALVSLICCTAGNLALFLLPILAKNTYISENALMPGSANPMFAGHDTIEANQLVKDIMRIKRDSGEAGIEISRLLSQNLKTMGAEVYHHKFHAQSNQMRPLQFFSASPNTWKLQGNSSCSSQGTNVVGIIRAPRSDGKETLVLVTPYNSSKIELNEALSLGLAYSVLSLLSRVNWLAKDIVWLAADSRHGEYASVGAWLLDYHTPVFSGLDEVNSDNCPQTNGAHDWKGSPIAGKKVHDVFRRAGTMAAALVIKVVDRREATRKDTLHIYSEASNGQMPNLDLINIVHYLAVHRQGLNVKVEKCYLLLNSAWVRIVGEILELIGKVARTLNSEWKFGITAKEYIEGTATLASSLYYQALGIPTGLHGAFRDYQVDAITLEISPKVSLHNDALRAEFLLRSGRLLEGIIRSVNNLLEKFHQSFFLYLMTSPHKFVSVGVYMIAFALLVAPLPIAAAALYSGEQTPHSTESWRWLHSANVVFLVHFWGIIVSLLPSLITRFSNTTPTNNMLAWVSLSIFTLVILGARNSKKVEWTTLKAVMIAVTSIGLCLMSIINYAAAQIGAILIVPLCLLVQPLKAKSGKIRRIGLAVCNIILAFVSFPPVGMLLVKGYLEGGFGNVGLGDFWTWAESLWAWNSATYLYLGLIHLPCWVLCVQVLLHPC